MKRALSAGGSGAAFAAICIAGITAMLGAGLRHAPADYRLLLALLVTATILLAAKILLVDRSQSVRALVEKRYNILESIPDGFFIVDSQFRFSHVNERAEELFDRSADQLVGQRVEDLLDPMASELLPEMERAAQTGTPLERTQYFQSTGKWVQIRIQPARDETLVYLRDVTERQKTEKASQEAERRLRLLLSQVPAVLFTVDLEMRITSVVGAGLAEHAFAEASLLGAPFEVLVSEHDQKKDCIAAVRRVFQGNAVSYETRRHDRWLQNDVEPLRDADGNVIGAVGVILDVTEVRSNAERFAQLARQDVMTGLPNRLALEERLPAQLDNALQHRESVAVLFVDLDRFKNINDTLGHRVGDELLRTVTQRMLARMDNRGTIYRPGGDEFVIVVDGIKHKRTVASISMDVLQAFAEPFDVDGRELFVTASLGASVFPQNAQTADELIAFADSAMYRAKEAGRNNAKFYDGTMHAHVLERMGLEQDLRQALARGELHLLFQPIVDLPTRRVVGAEALLRWQHPLLGELAPQTFVPIAEETGVIVEISRWVLREACANAARIRREGASDFHINVNLSPRDFYEQDLAATLAAVLAETGLPPEALALEVTESVVLNDLALDTLQRIAKMRVNVVVDDFGTGYSSLSYIKRLPVSAIKIDKSFIDEVAVDPYDQGIVKAIATLGNTLGLRIIAEGIESESQYEFLRSIKCEYAQGYFFYRPQQWNAFLSILQRSGEIGSSARVIPLYG
ncbi:MAG TPA: EAL domain-containing protein [Candidatus Baltobacteraceae bacterium]|nr:EAL domain-containing protein [Candidatus Baltobacteraceae bacterium]